MANGCFVYSKKQYEDIKRIEGLNVVKLGYVVVNGIAKPYTDLVENMRKAYYGDAIKIYEGDLDKISYTIRE